MKNKPPMLAEDWHQALQSSRPELKSLAKLAGYSICFRCRTVTFDSVRMETSHRLSPKVAGTRSVLMCADRAVGIVQRIEPQAQATLLLGEADASAYLAFLFLARAQKDDPAKPDVRYWQLSPIPFDAFEIKTTVGRTFLVRSVGEADLLEFRQMKHREFVTFLMDRVRTSRASLSAILAEP